MGSLAGLGTGYSAKKAGTILLNKGKDKLLTSLLRKTVGQSHSALYRQGNKFIQQGMVKINTSRGLSSITGTGISAGFSILKLYFGR